eukprot:1157590-Pelagomonas_calceolata.AAC.2
MNGLQGSVRVQSIKNKTLPWRSCSAYKGKVWTVAKAYSTPASTPAPLSAAAVVIVNTFFSYPSAGASA